MISKGIQSKHSLVDRCLSRRGDCFELSLDEASEILFRSEKEFAQFIEDLETFGGGNTGCSKITSLFVHGTFLEDLSEDRQRILLGSLAYLQELCISSAAISAKALVACLSRAPHLKKLCLDKAALFSTAFTHVEDQDKFCKTLQEMPKLKEIHLSLATSASISGRPMFVGETDKLDPLLLSLASIKSLKTAYLSFHRPGRGFIDDPMAISALARSVNDLTFKNCPLTREHCKSFGSLNQVSSLQALALISAGIGDEDAAALAESLSSCRSNGSTLKKLYLPGNDISGTGIAAIARNFHSTLELLDLHDNLVNARDILPLSEMLESSTSTLNYLDLSGNPLGDKGCFILARAITDNASLEQLNMLHCNLSNKACQSLASCLLKNRSLKRINLYSNDKIDQPGIASIVQRLEQNFAFESLMIPQKTEYKDADLFPRLNRVYDRENLLSIKTSDKTFVAEGLAKACAQDDLSALFYLLQSRPSICNPVQKARRKEYPRTKRLRVRQNTVAKELFRESQSVPLLHQTPILVTFSTRQA